jgi:hypothetical protein
VLAAPILLTLALAPADAPMSPPDAAVSDAGELQGEWEVVAAYFDLENKSRGYKGSRWRFAGRCVVHIDASGWLLPPYLVHVDPSAEPPATDTVMSYGLPARGIYRRSGDVLIWADEWWSGCRPSSFEPAEGFVVWTLRRVKK